MLPVSMTRISHFATSFDVLFKLSIGVCRGLQGVSFGSRLRKIGHVFAELWSDVQTPRESNVVVKHSMYLRS